MAGALQRHAALALADARVFFVAGWRSNVALFQWMTPAALATTVVGVPACQLVWFVHLGRYLGTHPVGFYAVGNAVHACAMAGLFAPVMTVYGERSGATLNALLATPANRALLFAGRVVAPVLLGAATAAVMLALGRVVAGVEVPADRLPLLAATLLATAASCSAFGLVLGAVALRTREALMLANLALYLMLLLCGVNLPRSSLPGPAEALGGLLPLTHGIVAARRAVDGGGGVLGLAGAELLKAGVYLVVAVALLHLLERQSRARATLDRM
jgi:ABC-2 type transport system permease protein